MRISDWSSDVCSSDLACSVFWIYPRNLAMPCLLDRFHPALVVVDVVDDHRAWPGVSEEEEQNLTRNYRDLLSLADIAMANCEPVQKAMRSEERRVGKEGVSKCKYRGWATH